ncbi:CPK3 [Symbiodinium sp. KB8]|nr:CPK3 [Symbiodinium sp. KB8]
MGRYARMQHADSSLSWTESSRCAVYSESSMTPAAAAAEFHAPSKEERAAGRALCGGLLWPPKAPGLPALCPGLPEAVPPALALALQRGLPDVLLYRCFLLLVRAKQIEDKDEKEAQRAYAPVLVKLKAMGFLADAAGQRKLLLWLGLAGAAIRALEDCDLAQLAKAARSLDGPNLSVSLQPHVPPVLNIKDEASRQLHVDHWRQVYLDCMKFFPRFFQPRTRVLAVPPSTEQEVEDLSCHLLLHGFAVLCIVHPTSEKTPKVDACIVVRGIGMLPVPEESSVQGSSCYLGLPPSTKSLCEHNGRTSLDRGDAEQVSSYAPLFGSGQIRPVPVGAPSVRVLRSGSPCKAAVSLQTAILIAGCAKRTWVGGMKWPLLSWLLCVGAALPRNSVGTLDGHPVLDFFQQLHTSSHTVFRGDGVASFIEANFDASIALQAPGNHTAHAHHNSSKQLLNTPQKEHDKMFVLSHFWLPILLVSSLLFEALHLKWSEVDWSRSAQRTDASEGTEERVDTSFAGLTVKLVRRADSLARIYFEGAGRVKGRSYMMMLVCHSLFGQYLSLVNFDYMSRFFDFYQHPSQAVFVALMSNWFVLYGSMCLTAVYSQYIESMLFIHWKDHMTRYFERIWVPHSYGFKMKDDSRVDNPDQRIQEDIGSFVPSTYDLTMGVLDATLQLSIYSIMLIQVQPKSAFPGLLFGIAILYTLIGSVAVHWIGRDLAFLSWQGERYGGHFRAELRRVHDQSETVAALRSHEAELQRLEQRFEALKWNKWQGMILKKRLGWFDRIYDPFKSVLFVCVLMPFFIKGEVSLGTVKQCEMALSRITASLGFFIHEYKHLASYRAQVDRLLLACNRGRRGDLVTLSDRRYNFRCCGLAFMQEKARTSSDSPGERPGGNGAAEEELDLEVDASLRQHLSTGEAVPAPPARTAEVLELRRARVSLPSGEVLLEADFRVSKGTSVLLCGGEGSGKSTFLRALAGIWPFTSAEEASAPLTSTDCFLIPQKPRLPMPITLRQALVFPESSNSFPDAEIATVLEKVRLAELLALGLDEPMDVNTVLSGGQFQKLMVAHCLLVNPAFILLDESMAHLSQQSQHHLYGLLIDELIGPGLCGLVSTCHNPQDLGRYHQVHYRISRKVRERCDSTGSTGSGLCTRKLELVEPGAAVEADTTSPVQDVHRRLAEQDEEIAMLQHAVQHLREKRPVKYGSLAAALASKGLPLALTAVLGPPPATPAAKPKASASSAKPKGGAPAPLVAIPPLPPALSTAPEVFETAPLLPPLPTRPPEPPPPPAPPPPPPPPPKCPPPPAHPDNKQKHEGTKEDQAAEIAHQIHSRASLKSCTAAANLSDWSEHKDAKTGRTYFHNRATGESTWSNPALAKAAAPRTKEPEAGLIPGTKDPVQEARMGRAKDCGELIESNMSEQSFESVSWADTERTGHSRAHASAVVGRLAGELLQSQEVVLVMRGSADETDFQSVRETLSVPPLGFVELLCTTDPAVIGDVMVPTSSRPSAWQPDRVMPMSVLRAGLGYSETVTASWLCDKTPDSAARGLARVALFSRVCGGYEVKTLLVAAMGCGASAQAKYAQAPKEKEPGNRKGSKEAEQEDDCPAIPHNRSRKRSITAVVRPNQRLVDFYQVENRGLAFASTQTGSREPRSNTRITLKATGEVRACRTIRRRRVDSYSASKEVEILLRTDHPNIVKLFEVFEDEVNMYVILQWCEGGNILERIQKEPDLSESAVAHILQQVLHAACHLHLNLICHRNLTLEHICLFERNLPLEKSVVKIWDFELATTLPKEGASMSESIVEHGNVSYMAPELLMQMPLYYTNADVWAIGVCAYVLLCGQLPFPGSTAEEVGKQIAHWTPTKHLAPETSTGTSTMGTGTTSMESTSSLFANWADVPEEARDFVTQLMDTDCNTRISAADAMKFDWLKTAHKEGRKLITPHTVQGILSYGTKTLLQKKCMQVIACHLPEEEIKELAKTFHTLDTNGDGEVSLSELKHAISLVGKRKGAKGKRKNSVSGPTDGDMLKLVAAMDSNGDNRISYTEFLAACLEEKHYHQEAACWHAFRFFDRDNDGKITRQELLEALKDEEFGDMLPQKVIADLVKAGDSNGNHTLDFYEFMALVQPDREWTAPQVASQGKDGKDAGPGPPSPLKADRRKRKNSNVGLCPSCGQSRQLKAFASLLQRRARSLVVEDDGFACALFEAYKALEQKGVVLVWEPTDVDLAIASVWPDCAAPEPLTPLSRKLADRCLRLADPDLGLGRLLGILPDGRPRTALATWPADVVLPGAEHGEFTVAGRRIWSETVEGEFASALAMTKHVLRLLFFASACRGQGPGPFRYSLLQFPRNLAPEDRPWVTIAVRDAVPWRSLDRHPEVYQTTPRLRPVKLCNTELKALRLEGDIVVEDAAGGKVCKGWRLSPGGDLPAVAPTAVLAAELLGVKSDAVTSPKTAEKPSQVLAELVGSCKEDSATLIFDTATPNELKATVPATRALPVDLCFQARGAEEFLTKTLEVPRRGHMQTEAMLLGASIARLAIQNEAAPLEWSDAAAALQRAEQALHGCSRSLQQLYCREMPDWLQESPPSRSKPRCRTLCNEAVGDVVEAWRLLSSESTVTDLGEYFTNQFLSLSCYGSLIATHPASYLSAEGPLLASEVLVNYNGPQPALHIWGALPVLSKPGRFAASA